MRALGYVLITAGFLAGSVVAVQTAENHINWGWFLPSFAVGVVGIVTVIGGLYLGLPVLAMRTLGYVPGGGLSIGSGPNSSPGVKPSTMP